MQIEIYADVIFIINAVMDFVILLAVGKLTRKKVSRVRLVVSALACSAAYCLSFFVLPYSTFLNALTAMAIIFGGVWIAYYPFSVREFVRLVLTAYITAFALGGAAFAVYFSINAGGDFSVPLLVVSTAAFYAALKFVLNRLRQSHINKQTFHSFYIWLGGKRAEAMGLVDTGNSLYEPISRSPVIVVEASVLKGILPKNIFELYTAKGEIDITLASEAFTKAGLHDKLRLIPFKGINDGGVLIGFKPEKIELPNCFVNMDRRDAVIGICNFILSADGEYNALLNPALVAK